MVKIMLDTNAVLDLVFNRYPDRHASMLGAISRCKEGTHELLVCAHSLMDMTYILENNAGMKAAMPNKSDRKACARSARETAFKFCKVCSVDDQTCRSAHGDEGEDAFGDAVVKACARAHEAHAIVTSDRRAFVSNDILKLTPAEFERFV